MPEVVAYARVSSDEQRRNETIRTQQEFLAKYADLHQIAVARWYLDDGVTGTLPLEQRPSGGQLLADARAGQVRCLLIYRLDRLGRSPRVIRQRPTAS